MIKVQNTTKSVFLINQMKKTQGFQSSWDWKADLEWAKRFRKDLVDVIDSAINGSAPSALIVSVWKSDSGWYKQVTLRRMETLRKMVKEGVAESSWSGTGYGGFYETGLRRVRTYILKEEFK